METKIPSLRICVTNRCNLECVYCPPSGDSFVCGSKLLTPKQIIEVVDRFYKRGVRRFTLTGGEPLMEPRLTFGLCEKISKLGSASLRTSTNGTLIENYINKISEYPIEMLAVSLDTLDSKKFEKITGFDSLDKVISGIKTARETGLNVRINMVVGRHNYDEVWDIIKFCEEVGAGLKLYDISDFDKLKSNNKSFLKDNRIPLISIENKLESIFGKSEIVYTEGGFGCPMNLYSDKIKTRCTSKGAFYVSECLDCNKYPCPEGFAHIILGRDGSIKPTRNECILALKLIDSKGQLESIDKKIDIMLNLFKRANFKRK